MEQTFEKIKVIRCDKATGVEKRGNDVLGHVKAVVTFKDKSGYVTFLQAYADSDSHFFPAIMAIRDYDEISLGFDEDGYLIRFSNHTLCKM